MKTQLMQPIAIPMEDDLVHTPEHPCCEDPTCPCHTDPLYQDLVQPAQICRVDLPITEKENARRE